MKRLMLWTVALATGALVGCATTPVAPEALQKARISMDHARLAPGATRASVEITEAETALVMAEAAFEVEPDSETTAHLAYVAWRKAQRAASLARTRLAVAQADDLEGRAAALAARVGETPDDLPGLTGPLVERDVEIEAEREFATTLAPVAMVQQLRDIGLTVVDEDAVYVRLAGDAPMFDHGATELALWARERLDRFAQVVMDSPHLIVVEGFSDDAGTPDENRLTSLKRAENARDYLQSKGIDRSRLSVIARGADAPVAPNATDEGRALNRRVELRLILR